MEIIINFIETILPLIMVGMGVVLVINYVKIKNSKKVVIGLALLIIYRLVVFILNSRLGLYIMVLGINQWIINLSVSVLIIITIVKLISNYTTKEMFKYAVNLLAVICIVLVIFMNLLENSSKSYFYFKSPDKSHTLVIEEDSFLLGGWSKFYEKEGFMLIKNIKQQISTDDGYKPFSNKDYEMKWIDNNWVEITYGFGNANAYKKEIVKFN